MQTIDTCNSTTPTTSRLAIAAFVVGILAFCPLPLIGSIAAIVMGHIAHVKIGRSNGTLKGSGMAIAGFICGYVSLLMIPVLAALSIPAFITVRHETMCAVADQSAQQITRVYHEQDAASGKNEIPVEEVMSRILLPNEMTLKEPTTAFTPWGTFTLVHPATGWRTYEVCSGTISDCEKPSQRDQQRKMVRP